MQLGFLVPDFIDFTKECCASHKNVVDACSFWSDILLQPCYHKTLDNVSRGRCTGESGRKTQRKTAPKKSITAISACDSAAFPTISRLLHIFAVQPVSTATPKGPFSTMRRLIKDVAQKQNGRGETDRISFDGN